MTLRGRAAALRPVALPLATLLALVIGLALRAGPSPLWSHRVWWISLLGLGLPVLLQTLRGVLARRFAADLVASLAILTAILLDQPLPGLIVVLMQTGGEALERLAAGRASRAVRELEALAPRRATRLGAGGPEVLPADAVQVGDRLLVRPGEMVPCDARVVEGHSHVDQSRLTGEPAPVTAEPGRWLMSGSLNIEGPLVIDVTALARESQYERIVQLVRSAQASKAPLQRMADRYAVLFTPATLAVCLAAWLLAGDPLRVLAVLVIATPCPLILAVPVAMIGGINRAARLGVVIRHGQGLERLGRATVALLDKTGTLTLGRPEVSTLRPLPPFSDTELLRLAAAVESGSGYHLAQSIVAAAEARGIVIPPATAVVESPGQGVTGMVEGEGVVIGSRAFLTARHPDLSPAWPDGGEGGSGLRAFMAAGGRPAGVIEFADRLRPETPRLVAGLKALGFRRVLLVTGDHAAHAREMAEAAGIDEVRADLLPAGKVEVVEELERAGERVLMMGDGTNDAPALTRADVGVALASSGGGITAEAADAVILADDAARVLDAIGISRRTLAIARQSVWVGLGLSAVGMGFAALGYIPPAAGALLQEAIDIAVILNAVRASSE